MTFECVPLKATAQMCNSYDGVLTQHTTIIL